jgi:hypothetical protein
VLALDCEDDDVALSKARVRGRFDDCYRDGDVAIRSADPQTARAKRLELLSARENVNVGAVMRQVPLCASAPPIPAPIPPAPYTR